MTPHPNLSRRYRLSLVRSARAHIVRAQAHALLEEMPECKLQAKAAIRELRYALVGWHGFDPSKLRKGWMRTT